MSQLNTNHAPSSPLKSDLPVTLGLLMFSVSPSAPRGTCCVGSTQRPTLPIVHAHRVPFGPWTHIHTHVRTDRSVTPGAARQVFFFEKSTVV